MTRIQTLLLCSVAALVVLSLFAPSANATDACSACTCTGNSLDSCPPTLTTVPTFPTNLDYIDLTGAQIANFPAGSFAGLDALQELHIGNAAPLTLAPGVFEGQSGLSGLVLSGVSQLTAGVFRGLENLRMLKISGTISTIPAGVLADVNATVDGLFLLNTGVASISNLPLAELPNLRMLSITNAPMSTIPSQAFSTFNLTKLEELYFTGSSIKSVESDAFAGLLQLQWLSLENCPISQFASKSFLGLDNLYSLNLNNLNATTFPPGLFYGLLNLVDFTMTPHKLGTGAAPPSMYKVGPNFYRCGAYCSTCVGDEYTCCPDNCLRCSEENSCTVCNPGFTVYSLIVGGDMHMGDFCRVPASVSSLSVIATRASRASTASASIATSASAVAATVASGASTASATVASAASAASTASASGASTASASVASGASTASASLASVASAADASTASFVASTSAAHVVSVNAMLDAANSSSGSGSVLAIAVGGAIGGLALLVLVAVFAIRRKAPREDPHYIAPEEVTYLNVDEKGGNDAAFLSMPHNYEAMDKPDPNFHNPLYEAIEGGPVTVTESTYTNVASAAVPASSEPVYGSETTTIYADTALAASIHAAPVQSSTTDYATIVGAVNATASTASSE
ncbi:hypothetical protein CAOG_08280 [Capsaspora owczarzaki ATCC 30864]|uniref:hypothetical protein n=1 Tax=Capsaspora owczarzaki (strain ATCC 30864) TaxID=595528 RepID=UPI00035207D9|nr:hypothetical protein CAOG_08280 [Capsaspora owczarzaki ATCC 30864]|eukprot:XP_004342385.2 hypothetical protein CAOG_08280 [Capsaspora owczarzaki ATCC 30864]